PLGRRLRARAGSARICSTLLDPGGGREFRRKPLIPHGARGQFPPCPPTGVPVQFPPMRVRTVEWKSGRVVMLDQRLLPNREVYPVYSEAEEVMQAIKEMVVRGAPAIGVAAAMGIALGARSLSADRFVRDFERLCRAFAATRPTAVN